MKKFINYTLVFVVVFAPLALFIKRQQFYDWYKLLGYTPSQRVDELADKTTMNSTARKIFYVNDPDVVSDKEQFRDSCSAGEATIVLGCFKSTDRIYIFDVTDSRLDGIHEVTAAHELLHAVYERMSDKEKSRIDKLVTDAFSRQSNPRLLNTIEQYRAKDPSVVPNELHSIIATEVRDIGQELEAYYKRFFDNRIKIVEYSEKYEAEFTSHEQKVASYDEQLEQKRLFIEGLEFDLENQSLTLKNRKQSIDLSSKQSVDEYNALVNAYNLGVKELNESVKDYNELVKTRNEEAKEWQNLVDAIDTRVENISN